MPKQDDTDFKKIAADDRFHGIWMPSEAWKILTEHLSTESYTPKRITRLLTGFCDSSKAKQLPSASIQSHKYTVLRDNKQTQCSFFLIHPNNTQLKESILDVDGGGNQWQRRYDNAMKYCGAIPRSREVEMFLLTKARVEEVNAPYREEAQKAIAEQREEEDKVSFDQDQWERAADMARVAWQEKYCTEFPLELLQNPPHKPQSNTGDLKNDPSSTVNLKYVSSNEEDTSVPVARPRSRIHTRTVRLREKNIVHVVHDVPNTYDIIEAPIILDHTVAEDYESETDSDLSFQFASQPP